MHVELPEVQRLAQRSLDIQANKGWVLMLIYMRFTFKKDLLCFNYNYFSYRVASYLICFLCGSLIPAREKDTSCAGNVAENRRHCLLGGQASRIFCNCSANPHNDPKKNSS